MARRPRPAIRRGKFFDYPHTGSTVPLWIVRRTRGRVLVLRRGDFFPMPWPAAPVTPAALPPQWIAARRRPSPRPLRRGEILPGPWLQVAAPPLVTLPQWIARRRTLPRPLRRGEILTPPWPASTPPPVLLEGRRPVRPARRRGTFLTVPPPQTPPIAPIGRPPAIGLANVRMSGSTPNRSYANKVPVRPRPH